MVNSCAEINISARKATCVRNDILTNKSKAAGAMVSSTQAKLGRLNHLLQTVGRMREVSKSYNPPAKKKPGEIPNQLAYVPDLVGEFVSMRDFPESLPERPDSDELKTHKNSTIAKLSTDSPKWMSDIYITEPCYCSVL